MLAFRSRSTRFATTGFAIALAILALGAMMLAPAASRAADPFYDRLFLDGGLSLSRGDDAGAARQLRLACFGLLAEPEPLALCLGQLAVAQSRLEDEEGLLDTIGRILEVERRFRVYSTVDLSPELRRELEASIEAWAPPEALVDLPAFRHLAERRRLAAAEAASAEEGDADEAEGASPSEPSPVPASLPGDPNEPTEVEEAILADHRQVLVADLRERFGDAFDSVRSLAERYPDWLDAQLVAAELAYRLSRWTDSVRYFHRADDVLEERPELQFYLAVALFKSGDPEAARDMLDRCLPRIRSSSFVDFWVEKIRDDTPGSRTP